ncbi:MAG: hypothetical protein ABI594_14285 [Ginsengibacter sp.]
MLVIISHQCRVQTKNIFFWRETKVNIVMGYRKENAMDVQDFQNYLYKIVPLTEAANFPFFSKNINDEDEFEANEMSVKAADNMLKQLLRWTKGLKTIKEDKG